MGQRRDFIRLRMVPYGARCSGGAIGVSQVLMGGAESDPGPTKARVAAFGKGLGNWGVLAVRHNREALFGGHGQARASVISSAKQNNVLV